MPYLSHIPWSSWETNWGPLSMTITFGTPNLAMILVLMNLTIVVALISAKASASAHFVYYSVVVRIKDFCFEASDPVSDKGLTTSNAHIEKGHGEDKGWREDAGAWILST